MAKALPSYRGGALRRDLLAAATVAALAVPSAMAYAEVAGVSPIHGLYALLVPAVAYAVFGSSRLVIVGPEGSLSALVAAAVLGLAAAGSEEAAGLAAAMALLVGGCFLLARRLRLGFLADYFSRPVLVGYIHGVAVVLIISQLGKLLGLDVDARDPLPQLREVIGELGRTSAATLAVSIVALAVLLPLRYLAPRLPAALLVVAGTITAQSLFDFDVAVVGEIPSGLPRPEVPPLDQLASLAPAAFGLFLVCFADEILTARSFAGRHDEHAGVGQELVAVGTANLAAGLTQGLPVGASGSRTAVNDAMGARSQVSGLLAAAFVALVLLFLTGPIADLPTAVLGAVIVAACIGLIAPAEWRALWTVDRVEVGRLGRYGDVAPHRSAEITPGVVVYRLDDRLFFANAGYVKGRIREALRAAPTPSHALVLDAAGVAHVDSAGLDVLADLEQRIDLHVARATAGLTARLEPALRSVHFHPTVRVAVQEASHHDH